VSGHRIGRHGEFVIHPASTPPSGGGFRPATHKANLRAPAILRPGPVLLVLLYCQLERGAGMTERKPPGTSWETWIERQIRVAMEEGAFDNLPGAGKPLPNIDRGFDLNIWVRQLVQREQLSISSMLPPSLELLRKVETEIAAIGQLGDEAMVRSRVAALNAEIAKVNATVTEGPPTRLGTLDVDQVVARWRQARSAVRQPVSN
jgi:hypothetical protein